MIYWYRCNRLGFNKKYIGKSAKTIEERFKEHLKAPSPIYDYQQKTGLCTSVEDFNMLGREGHSLTRSLIQSIFMRVSNLILNRNIGKYNLPDIWGRVLFCLAAHNPSQEQRRKNKNHP